MAPKPGNEQEGHQVEIFIDTDDVCKVKPAILIVDPMDSVVFTAVNTRARITFPEDQPFGSVPPHRIVNHKTSEKNWKTNVRGDAPHGAEYEYTVYCDETKKYAKAESLPKVRIKNG